MKRKSETATTTGRPPMRAVPVVTASLPPLFSRASSSRSRYGRESEKCSGSGEVTPAKRSSNESASRSRAIHCEAEIGSRWPHEEQTPALSNSASAVRSASQPRQRGGSGASSMPSVFWLERANQFIAQFRPWIHCRAGREGQT